SDWSSDVCSSDLICGNHSKPFCSLHFGGRIRRGYLWEPWKTGFLGAHLLDGRHFYALASTNSPHLFQFFSTGFGGEAQCEKFVEIGRASCREREEGEQA